MNKWHETMLGCYKTSDVESIHDVVRKGHPTGAIFSDCETYRYLLWRTFSGNPDGDVLLAILLNPSTADARKNDPTVERVCRRAERAGFGRLYLMNIYGLRSTDRSKLWDVDDPIGPDNDEIIVDTLRVFAHTAPTVICGWGNEGKRNGRGAAVTQMILDAGLTPCAWKVTKNGEPGHPLYIGYDVEPVEYVRK